jgi:hypothetical protein
VKHHVNLLTQSAEKVFAFFRFNANHISQVTDEIEEGDGEGNTEKGEPVNAANEKEPEEVHEEPFQKVTYQYETAEQHGDANEQEKEGHDNHDHDERKPHDDDEAGDGESKPTDYSVSRQNSQQSTDAFEHEHAQSKVSSHRSSVQQDEYKNNGADDHVEENDYDRVPSAGSRDVHEKGDHESVSRRSSAKQHDVDEQDNGHNGGSVDGGSPTHDNAAAESKRAFIHNDNADHPDDADGALNDRRASHASSVHSQHANDNVLHSKSGRAASPPAEESDV